MIQYTGLPVCALLEACFLDWSVLQVSRMLNVISSAVVCSVQAMFSETNIVVG